MKFSLLITLLVVTTSVYAQETPKQSGLPAEGYPHSDTDQIPGQKWHVHDKERPEPGIIKPGTASTSDKPGKAPSDAIVLFDGKDISKWVKGNGKAPAAWKVENGYMEVNGTGTIKTAQAFGSCQLHVEWAAPKEVKSKSQGRGNSGVLIMERYEFQVLDSFNNRSYSDGQASAIYGQYPPQVNAMRAPGEWQTYDIIFEAPEFDGDKLKKPAFATVIHNGVLVHHYAKILGAVAHKYAPKYRKHPAKLPLSLQDHGNPIRFRNIWVRPIKTADQIAKENAPVEKKEEEAAEK